MSNWEKFKGNLKRGDLMSVSEWLDCVEEGGFIDYDGYGDVLKQTQFGWQALEHSVFPSTAHTVPADATHILWYNR